MRLIDTNTGHEAKIGEPFHNVHGRVTVRQLNERFFGADALIAIDQNDEPFVRWVPLTVRYLHPAFLFQKVAFIPS